jgi:hypothetical protein
VADKHKGNYYAMAIKHTGHCYSPARNKDYDVVFSMWSILHKDYDLKGSVAKKRLVVSLKRLGTKTN